MKRYYIAYGSNLNVEQMAYRCPGARPIGTCWLNDYELLFKGSKTGSYLTVEPCIGSKVPVAVWEVSAANEASLDRYEGFPTFYYKMEKDLAKGGKIIGKAFVYVMHEDRKIGVPSRYYVDTCLEGYKAFGFDKKYLDKALKKSKQIQKREREDNDGTTYYVEW